jgi:hypothetical protein
MSLPEYRKHFHDAPLSVQPEVSIIMIRGLVRSICSIHMLNTSISTHHANDKQEEDEEKYEA